MDSTVITIPVSEPPVVGPPTKEKKKFKLPKIFNTIICFIKDKIRNKQDMRKLIHSIKVGVSLVLVSFLYLLNPLYERVGDNAMWAIMTVVVVFEFFAGATVRKGLNRGMGTILGGSLGCLAAALAQKVGGIGDSIIVSISVFIFGVAATYFRMIPSIKKKYDYGAMIFLLTFNLVVVSGIRAEKVLELARERLLTIGMGFAVCVFISLLVFPTWASDELHDSIASNFLHLATSIEGCLDEYFKAVEEKENQPTSSISNCKSVLNSKSQDESLANFANWEPWHGKFGLYHPWDKYLKIGDLLRELSAAILSLKDCLRSPKQPSSTMRQSIRQPCEAVGVSLAWTLKELGENIKEMKRVQQADMIAPKLKSMSLELSSVISSSKLEQLENVDGLAIASFIFMLMEMVEKVEKLVKEVEEFGDLAGFKDQ
ncbi:aluminum-activated malate transporter 8 [Ziziphus jujuba]|uniref:Aluminum-activated malate transporter 8 n=1 Tax=Ziziphus jujuba TaxID=326968 RepID=A0A6P4ASC8_ZIZJJ|nr:aluminum-activated malate transporter 8 [Ziziphus jujuba]